MSNKSNSTTRSEKFKLIEELAKKADEQANSGALIEIPFSGHGLEDEDKEAIRAIQDTQNPKISYRLFYGIQALLTQNLPQGPEYKKLRVYVYELKSIFLNRGKTKDEFGRRGSDSRQAYITSELKVMFELVTDWVKDGANSSDLITRLQELNRINNYSIGEN